MTREEYFVGLKEVLAENKLRIKKFTSCSSSTPKSDLSAEDRKPYS